MPPARGAVNDLSGTAGKRQQRRLWPVPRQALCVAVPCLLLGLGVSVFILAVVHNAVLLVLLLALCALIFSLLGWNLRAAREDQALLIFLDEFPWSDLRAAEDGDLVKLSGLVSCGNLPLQSSYEKASGCVYTSTLLYERRGCGLSPWRLAFSERFAADFHLTDSRSGMRVTVRAGEGSKLSSLVKETVLVNATSKSGSPSLTLVKWLRERQLSTERRALRLEEGYVKEGTQLTVMGMVNRSSGDVTILPLSEPISTGCLFQKLLLPVVVDGLIFKITDDIAAEESVRHRLPC